MKLSLVKIGSWRSGMLGALILLALIALVFAWTVKQRASRDLAAARTELERASFVPFEKQARAAIDARGINLIQSRRQVRSLALFNNSYFAATDGGLVESDEAGKILRAWTVLDGLPESDLTCLTPFNSKLFIGTRSQGLVVFDGRKFERYRWPGRNAQAITAMLEDRGRLLFGTFNGGLLEFDGSKFKEIKTGAKQERLREINHLAVDGSQLFVGTFADGLWVSEAGRWFHFTVADGLPSNRVVGVVAGPDKLLVATDFGVGSASSAQLTNSPEAPSRPAFQTIATLPSLSSLIKFGDAILVSKDNGEVFRLLADPRLPNRSQLAPRLWNRPENLSSCRLHELTEPIKPRGKQSERALWLLSDKGVWRTNRRDERFSGRLSLAPLAELSSSNQPSSNLISALAFDDLGRLWAGSFRNGIDVFTPEGRKLAHIESDAVREINALVWDADAKRMLAATAQGLIRFDGPTQSQLISKTDGLLSNSISHLASLSSKNSNRSRLILATSRGLSFGEGANWRGLTTAQGLPSNSVYAVLPYRESIYAGTLNGLVQLTSGRVARVFKDSNSKLSQNWVTSLCAAGPRLFVGTYGGGVFELTPAGQFAGFAGEIGRQTVNPNAMTSDGEMLYVGTLDGVRVLDLRTQKWMHLKSELPASAVLSVTSDERCVYFGTTNGIARIDKNYLKSVGE